MQLSANFNMCILCTLQNYWIDKNNYKYYFPKQNLIILKKYI